MTTEKPDNMAQRPRDVILLTLANIPRGKVSTYGEIARRAGFPGAARHVAMILKQLPEHSAIPWHRVINSGGKSSFPTSSPLLSEQITLLKAEGVQFSSSGRVLKDYFW
jgi:methylated-DNA-protein-cysteine methyltransferase-like protein